MAQPKINNTQLAGPTFDIARIIRVDTEAKVGSFTSIKAAVDSVTDATALNPVAVFVGPGTYTENTITLKPYVKLIAWAGYTHTFIVPTVATNTIVVGTNNAELEGFTLSNANGVGGQGLDYTASTSSTSGTFRMRHVRFIGNETDCYFHSDTYDTYLIADDLYFTTYSNSTLNHIKAVSTGAAVLVGIISNTNIVNVFGSALTEAVFATGANTNLTFNGITIKSLAANSPGDGIVTQDGAVTEILAGSIEGFNKNIVARNVGAAPTLKVAVNISSDSTLYDLSVEHPGTIGLFTGSAYQSKVNVDSSSPIAISYIDTDTTAGQVISGRLYFGPTHNTITDISTLINESSPSGLLSGGVLTQGTNPLDVDVSGGYGYVNITNGYTFNKKVSWNTTTLTLPDNTNNYVYINSAGVVSSSNSEPDGLANVLLGRIRTLAGVITYISSTPRYIKNISTKFDDYLRSAIGSVYKSGSVVTENVTPLHLDVSSGIYYYSQLTFNPSGGTNVSFYPWYVTTGTWTKGTLVNLVSNTQYNNPATGLTALTTGYYTKHVLYVGGDGSTEQYGLVYGQAEYSSLILAEQAAIPLPPPVFTDNIAPIAAIIVQEGTANIIEFIDIRPRIGFQNPSTSAATVHGNLLNLGADDHTQYLLTNGTRALTGNLSLGTHNLTNVGTVNNVTVEAHQSRHLPNGADALTTAAPLVALSLSSTNSVGTANSLARSDHSHAITGIPVIQSLTGTIPGSNGVTAIPFDNTAPLDTEGTQIWSQSITPKTISSKIKTEFNITVDCSSSNAAIIVGLFRGTTCIASQVWGTGTGNGDKPDTISFAFVDSPATTSATTYSARIGTTSGIWYCNSTTGGTDLGGTLATTYELSELA